MINKIIVARYRRPPLSPPSLAVRARFRSRRDRFHRFPIFREGSDGMSSDTRSDELVRHFSSLSSSRASRFNGDASDGIQFSYPSSLVASSLVDESESAIARQSSRRSLGFSVTTYDLRDLRVKSYQRGVRDHDDDRFEGSSGPIARLSRARNLHTGLRLHPRLK